MWEFFGMMEITTKFIEDGLEMMEAIENDKLERKRK